MNEPQPQSISDWLGSGLEYIQSRPSLNATIQLIGLGLLVYGIYRLLMSDPLSPLRKKVPILNYLYGRRRVRQWLKQGEFAQAAEEWIGLERWGDAIAVFERGRLFGRAADLELKRRNKRRAAELYEKAGDHTRAASLYTEINDLDKAKENVARSDSPAAFGELLLSRGQTDAAITAFLKNNEPIRAATILADCDRYAEAAEILKRSYTEQRRAAKTGAEAVDQNEVLELGLRAAAWFEEAGTHRQAADIYQELGKIEEAARCFDAAGDRDVSANLYESAGDFKNASKIHRDLGDMAKALRLEAEDHLQRGEGNEAVVKLQEAGEFIRAGEILRDLDQPAKAAEMYERANEYGLAASIFKDLDQHGDAARMYEALSQWNSAEEMYREAKMPDKEVAMQIKGERLFEAAQNLHKMGRLDEALTLLDRLLVTSPDHREALSLRGIIYLDQGDRPKAQQDFERSLDKAERLSGTDIETIYHLGQISNVSKDPSSTISFLERKMAQGQVDEEALSRAETVHRILSERMQTELSGLDQATVVSQVQKRQDEGDSTAPKTRRYKLIKEIGRGGMGVVFTAQDTVLDRTVALKILSSGLKRNDQAVETFLREAKSAASLNHPNIVTVFDTGTQQGDYYISMERIDGETVKEKMRREGKLRPPLFDDILHQLLRGLEYAHSGHVVHRDLSTNNMMWTKQGVLKIMDFGLAKIVKDLMMEQSIVGGTPSYMSPEQTVGDPIDHRTDIYSLGICIYEMWLGELPFRKGDMGFHHLHTDPPVPKEKDPGIPDVLNHIILRCMEKKPERRFQSVSEVINLFPEAKGSPTENR